MSNIYIYIHVFQSELTSYFLSVSLWLQCADEAMALLHGRTVNGVKMKVMLADPPREESHKRLRTY